MSAGWLIQTPVSTRLLAYLHFKGQHNRSKNTLVIGSKAQADKVLVESLFKPVNGQTLKRERYDMGKYAHNLKGKTVEVIGGTVALWMERRKDSHGPYWALFCLSAA
ncbi:TPA: hypothetical protein VDU83_006726 [Pseudomonas aeruginosa]|nr:hypothetical protein [Pseudomonas aeruginosa]